MRLRVAALPGGRLHLVDGPVELIVQAWADAAATRHALDAACTRAGSILDELCAELPLLRAAASGPIAQGEVARAMQAATLPHAARGFITPMAAVAGAVADAVLAAMLDTARLDRAMVNNGGDIAVHVAPGETITVGAAQLGDRPGLFGTLALRASGGIATSGWRGRSFSLGIADAATVLARNAATADAAATPIANAIDLPGHPAVRRVAASALQPDSDLGPRLVTQGVGPLDAPEVAAALARGAAEAEALLAAGLIQGAALRLQGQTRVVGRPALAYFSTNAFSTT